MSTISGPMPTALYMELYGKWAPRACVDIIVADPRKGVLLQKRDIAPKGIWHLPGGSIWKGEALADAAVRHALDAGVWIENPVVVGTVEILDLLMEVDGIPIRMHNIMTEMEASTYVVQQLSRCFWWKMSPRLDAGICDIKQMEFLIRKGYVDAP